MKGSEHPRHSPVDRHIAEDKGELRATLLRARAMLDPAVRAVAGAALADRFLELPELAEADTVAVYSSIGTEPATTAIVDAARRAGLRVLLPMLLKNNDLGWGIYTGPAHLRRGPRGLWEPDGPLLEVNTILNAQVVLVPALAVDRAGTRLGRGGGSYDRALTRLPAHRLVAAVLYDGEVFDRLPAAAHDRPVTAALTPTRTFRFGVTRQGVTRKEPGPGAG